MEKEVVYIFISHSHRDVNKVRSIRNYLESKGAEPILFFLKSKNDEDEIEQLIKDEIDARVWFIYCKSSNAETSKWVKKEREYVALRGKRNITIDIDTCVNSKGVLTDEAKTRLNEIVDNFRSLQKIYISYSHYDVEIVGRVRRLLMQYGVETFFDQDLRISNHSWFKTITDEITASPFYLLFISKHSLNSKWIEKEFRMAASMKKQIIPVIISERYDDREELFNDSVAKQFLTDEVNCFFIDAYSEETFKKA